MPRPYWEPLHWSMLKVFRRIASDAAGVVPWHSSCCVTSPTFVGFGARGLELRLES